MRGNAVTRGHGRQAILADLKLGEMQLCGLAIARHVRVDGDPDRPANGIRRKERTGGRQQGHQLLPTETPGKFPPPAVFVFQLQRLMGARSIRYWSRSRSW